MRLLRSIQILVPGRIRRGNLSAWSGTSLDPLSQYCSLMLRQRDRVFDVAGIGSGCAIGTADVDGDGDALSSGRILWVFRLLAGLLYRGLRSCATSVGGGNG